MRVFVDFNSTTPICYLIHTPFAFRPGDEQDPRDENGQVIYDKGATLAETWGAMAALVDDGHCRAIGLSDITLDKLREIVAVARIKHSDIPRRQTCCRMR